MKKSFVAIALVLGLCYLNRTDAESAVPELRCAEQLADLTNPRIMSYQTAQREARSICRELRKERYNFYRAITQ